MIDLDLTRAELKLKKEGSRTLVFDPVRRKWIVLTPEEHVRQALLHHCIGVLHYPPALVAVEKTISIGTLSRRYDIVVYNRLHQPWLLAECKAPEVPVGEAALHQLLHYQSIVQGRYWVLCNGISTYCADAADPARIQWVNALPAYDL